MGIRRKWRSMILTVDADLRVLVIQDQIVCDAERVVLSSVEKLNELVARHARRKLQRETVLEDVFVDLEGLHFTQEK